MAKLGRKKGNRGRQGRAGLVLWFEDAKDGIEMFGKRSTSGAVVVQPAGPARVLDTASMKLAPTPAQPIPVAPVTTQTERAPRQFTIRPRA